jgi:bifunctional DNA-binding transcriptional regulator/antitoxin component of YhaV-PrlF toxin-antitoxin module
MFTVRVTELGVALPLEVLGQFGLALGDDLQITSSGGEVQMKKIDAEAPSRDKSTEQIMTQRADVLRRLAD